MKPLSFLFLFSFFLSCAKSPTSEGPKSDAQFFYATNAKQDRALFLWMSLEQKEENEAPQMCWYTHTIEGAEQVAKYAERKHFFELDESLKQSELITPKRVLMASLESGLSAVGRRDFAGEVAPFVESAQKFFGLVGEKVDEFCAIATRPASAQAAPTESLGLSWNDVLSYMPAVSQVLGEVRSCASSPAIACVAGTIHAIAENTGNDALKTFLQEGCQMAKKGLEMTNQAPEAFKNQFAAFRAVLQGNRQVFSQLSPAQQGEVEQLLAAVRTEIELWMERQKVTASLLKAFQAGARNASNQSSGSPCPTAAVAFDQMKAMIEAGMIHEEEDVQRTEVVASPPSQNETTTSQEEAPQSQEEEESQVPATVPAGGVRNLLNTVGSQVGVSF